MAFLRFFAFALQFTSIFFFDFVFSGYDTFCIVHFAQEGFLDFACRVAGNFGRRDEILPQALQYDAV